MPVLLDQRLWFPEPDTANDDGLVAMGGDFSPERLLLAYRSGIFPWTARPITWWSPDPRGVIDLDAYHIPHSVARFLRHCPYAITIDRAFRSVMEACAAPGPKRGGVWITPEFIDAYTHLHELGHAHSVECWQGNQLVGGIYGVAINGLFAGESMFHSADNASKVVLVHLIEHLRARGFALLDIQMVTPATKPFGAHPIPRTEYLARLGHAIKLECAWAHVEK